MKIEGTVDVNDALLGIFILGIVLGFGAGVASPVDLKQTNNRDPIPTDENLKEQQDSVRTFTTKSEPLLGDKDAPVTMVIFEDYECPFCKRFEEGAFPQIVDEYVESGKVKVVWKDYPLSIHPWAKPAAETTECVYRQDNDAFWEVKKKIFDQQNEISTDNVESKIIGWAGEEGVSNSSIQSCMGQESVVSEIEEDMKEGGRLGTPTTFINGQKLSGAQPFSRYQTVIESELS